METLFRWIHLSDIHVGHGDAGYGWDQKLVMDALRRDVAAQVKKDQAPIDAILVTGDIAFSGAGKSPTEYEQAKTWLLGLASDAGVSARQIFLVPGNHDVNWGVEGNDRNTKRLLEGLRGGRDQLDGVLADKGDRALLASRMAGYLALAKDFAAVSSSEEGLFWVHRMAARGGLRVRLVGLNTALLAARDDLGKLCLGRRQISMALHDPIEEGELVMVLSHHPFSGGWLVDEREADAWIRNHAHVHLSGHVHDADTEAARKGSGGVFVRIVAGSVHGDESEPASHGYSFGAVVLTDEGKPRLRVWPRKWASKRKAFILDAESVPDDETFAEHELRLKVAPVPSSAEMPSAQAQAQPQPRAPSSMSGTSAGAIPRSAPGRAINTFISFCQEDEALAEALEKQLIPLQRKGLISIATNKAITAGEEWPDALKRNIESAQMILLLLSPDYLASEECYEVEMPAAHLQAKTRGALVIPVLLRPTTLSDLWSKDDTEKEWFEKLRRLPLDGKPVTKWGDRDEALSHIAREIRKLAENLRRA